MAICKVTIQFLIVKVNDLWFLGLQGNLACVYEKPQPVVYLRHRFILKKCKHCKKHTFLKSSLWETSADVKDFYTLMLSTQEDT